MSDIPLCATCKHWSRTGDYDDEPIVPTMRDDSGHEMHTDNWERIPAPGEWGWCQKAAEFGPSASDLFYVVDGSEYVAHLHTRAEFGCVEWATQDEGA